MPVDFARDSIDELISDLDSWAEDHWEPTDWEIEFLDSIREVKDHTELTVKQAIKLAEIYNGAERRGEEVMFIRISDNDLEEFDLVELYSLWLDFLKEDEKKTTFPWWDGTRDENLITQLLKRGEELSGGYRRQFVALDDHTNKYLGVVTAFVSQQKQWYGWLWILYVRPEYRRQGIGDKLVQSALGWLENEGCTVIAVDVSGGREENLEFYKRYGFEIRSYSLARVKEEPV